MPFFLYFIFLLEAWGGNRCARHGLRVKEMELNDFIDEVLKRFDEQITDSVFCFIENDRELTKEFLDQVAAAGSLQDVNMYIGLRVESHYGLEAIKDKKNKNKNVTIDNPRSKLVQTPSRLIKKSAKTQLVKPAKR